MSTDVVIVEVSDYPYSGGRLNKLPGTVRDGLRMRNWLRTQAPAAKIQNFSWPLAASPDALAWNATSVSATLESLLRDGLDEPRRRLILYASAHGRFMSSSPPIPAVFCPSHRVKFPDLLAAGDWVRNLTGAPSYDEYLCFFDCCNDPYLGPVPFLPPLNMQPRDGQPRVLAMAACEPAQQALSHGQNGGVFTDVLLEALSGSAGTSTTGAVTAADIVAYVKENVPPRAAQLRAGHVQRPIEWLDPYAHQKLDSFELFQRQAVSGVDVRALLQGHSADGTEVLAHDLSVVGALQAGADGAAVLPTLLPGKYVLRHAAGAWHQTIRVKTAVQDDGSVVALAETPVGA